MSCIFNNMKIPFFTVAMKRFFRNRIRRIMRGHRFLKETDRLHLIAAIEDELAIANFTKINRGASKLFFGSGVKNAEMIIRQKLLKRISSYDLNKALLYSLGTKGSPVVYPMPMLWQRVVARHEFRVARIRCFLAWIGCVGMFWAYGVWVIIKHLYASLREIIRPHVVFYGRYAYFLGLTAGNLPQPCRDGRSHDIVTWYIYWKGRTEQVDIFCHGVANAKVCKVNGIPVVFNPWLIPPLGNFFGLFRFFAWAFAAVFCSIFDLFRGYWWHSLLLAESADAAMVRFQTVDKLAKDYIFHNSVTIYRPLWTYEAEEKGIKITAYFYATNMEGIKRHNGNLMQVNIWQAMNWPLYLVWDEYLANFVRRAVGRAVNIEVVGPIWFQTSSMEMPKLPAGSVAVFDVQPYRSSIHSVHCGPVEYSVPEVANQLLLDVYSVVRECGGVMVHKRKRNIGNSIHPKYRALLKTLSVVDGFIPIEPDTSAVRVIESCSAVISRPFTSTALWGRELGKPSVYYDPCGIVPKDDLAAHGIPVLSGKEELRNWLRSVLPESTKSVYVR